MFLLEKDYRLNGWHKKETFDTHGDYNTIEYYQDYDGVTYLNLQVKEIRTYTRDISTGLINKRNITINWYSAGDIAFTKNLVKYYTATRGHTANKKARQNLINDASMFLFSQVGKTSATIFWKQIRPEINDYINTSDLSLITVINNSTEEYMTTAIKSTLVTILNITY